MKNLILVLFSILLFACGSKAKEAQGGSKDAPNKVCCADCIKSNLGKTVELTGTVENTKLAPSIAGTGFNVYCLDAVLPEAKAKNKVRATGRLERTDAFAAKEIEGSPGVVSQGTEGKDLVLYDCSLEFID